MKRKYNKPAIEIIGIITSPILSVSGDDIYVGGSDETVTGGKDVQYGGEHRNDWDNIWADN